MSTTDPQEAVGFSLAGGGLLDVLTRHTGLRIRGVVRAIAFAVVLWLPLLILSALEGTAAGGSVRLTFLDDYRVYGRFLIAVPILVLVEAPMGRRTSSVSREFLTSAFVPEHDVPAFNSAVRGATRWRDSVVPEAILLAAVYAFVALRSRGALSDDVSTWYRAGRGVTMAGWYLVLLSLPVFQFLLIRWIWRLILWTGLLWKVSRLDLQLLPIHPDKTGGLGFVGLAQVPFGAVGFACGAALSSHLANGIVHRGASIAASSTSMVGYVILAVLVILAPVLVFTDRLVRLRLDGILRYGDLGERYAMLFDRKWVKGVNPEEEPVLGSPDIQSLADIRNSFDIIQNLSVIAADPKTIMVIVVLTAAPMIPLFFLAFPFHTIVAAILGISVR